MCCLIAFGVAPAADAEPAAAEDVVVDDLDDDLESGVARGASKKSKRSPPAAAAPPADASPERQQLMHLLQHLFGKHAEKVSVQKLQPYP